jgi:hypothetical protein
MMLCFVCEKTRVGNAHAVRKYTSLAREAGWKFKKRAHRWILPPLDIATVIAAIGISKNIVRRNHKYRCTVREEIT